MKMLIEYGCCAFCTISQNSDLTTVKDITSSFELQNNATGRFEVKKQENIVFVIFDIALPASYTTDASFLFAKTNSTYRPATYAFFNAMRGVSTMTGQACRGVMDNSGAIYLFCPVGTSGSVRGSFTYFIA